MGDMISEVVKGVVGRRKFAVCMTSLSMSFVLAIWKLDGDQIVQFWPWIVGLHLGLYGGANVAEWLAKRGQPVRA